MKQPIFPSKSYLIFYGKNQAFEVSLDKISERIGFRVLQVQSPEELKEALAKVKFPVGVVCLSAGEALPPSVKESPNFFSINSQSSVEDMTKQLEKHLTSSLPKRLIELVENTVADITPMFLGNTFKDFKRNFDFGLKFTHLVTCDTSADGFSAKIACEINFKKMRSIYPDQKNKTDHQLVDVFSELCNQTLGVINVGLRQIGLQPMISLPICAELSANSAISQVDYMPMIRFVDGQETLAINVSLHVDALCVARWGDLITQASKGDIEFF